jgi:hypothetical protein
MGYGDFSILCIDDVVLLYFDSVVLHQLYFCSDVLHSALDCDVMAQVVPPCCKSCCINDYDQCG